LAQERRQASPVKIRRRIELEIGSQELRRSVEYQLAAAKHQERVAIPQTVHRVGNAHDSHPLLPRQLAQQRGKRGLGRQVERLPGLVA